MLLPSEGPECDRSVDIEIVPSTLVRTGARRGDTGPLGPWDDGVPSDEVPDVVTRSCAGNLKTCREARGAAKNGPAALMSQTRGDWTHLATGLVSLIDVTAWSRNWGKYLKGSCRPGLGEVTVCVRAG